MQELTRLTTKYHFSLLSCLLFGLELSRLLSLGYHLLLSKQSFPSRLVSS
jgi:hypothetical protein